jgi:hypothetical protein
MLVGIRGVLFIGVRSFDKGLISSYVDDMNIS